MDHKFVSTVNGPLGMGYWCNGRFHMKAPNDICVTCGESVEFDRGFAVSHAARRVRGVWSLQER